MGKAKAKAKAKRKKRGTRAAVTKRASARGASAKSTARSVKRAPARTTARKNPRSRSSATVAGQGSSAKTAGPSMPLRDLIRGGMPRSAKAPGGASVTTSPRAKRRQKTAHGIKQGAGMQQHQPAPLIRHGYMREAVFRRG